VCWKNRKKKENQEEEEKKLPPLLSCNRACGDNAQQHQQCDDSEWRDERYFADNVEIIGGVSVQIENPIRVMEDHEVVPGGRIGPDQHGLDLTVFIRGI